MAILAYIMFGAVSFTILRMAYIAYFPSFYQLNFISIFFLGGVIWPIAWILLLIDIFVVFYLRKKENENVRN